MIRGEDRLFRLVERDPVLAAVLAETVPGLEKLRSGVGRIVGRVMTVERAARMAGMETEELIRRLERSGADAGSTPAAAGKNERAGAPAPTKGTGMANEATPPAALAAIPAELVVDVDVRETLRAGGEPFAEIMAARRRLPPGGVLRLRAIFEPVPLYFVLGGQGLDHWTEKLADDDWRVWFFAASAPGDAAPAAGDASTPGYAAATGLPVVPVAPVAPASPPPEEDVVVLDVRGLEPPEPMVQTLAALEELAPGKTLVQLNVRVPRFLLPMLEDRGFSYEIREQGPTLVRTFIRRRQEAQEDRRNPMSNETARELDVRVIPPREKHPAIFSTFGALDPGEAFVLVNDHDPVPLRYQFEAQHSGRYGWEYLQQGPAVWRVRISRK